MFNRSESVNFSKEKYQEGDYHDQLVYLGDQFLSSFSSKISIITGKREEYLRSIFNRIISNNELLFQNINPPKFYIIQDKRPYFFSLPGGKIFLSINLLKNYIRHEGDLLSLLVFEFIKSYKNLYEKKIAIPTGYYDSQYLVSKTRISLYDRMVIWKWSYYVVKRSGFDAYYLLSWIQQMNKHSLQFSFMNKSIQNMVKEEYLFKNFIVKEDINNKIARMKRNSTQEFYDFIYYVKKIKFNGGA